MEVEAEATVTFSLNVFEANVLKTILGKATKRELERKGLDEDAWDVVLDLHGHLLDNTA